MHTSVGTIACGWHVVVHTGRYTSCNGEGVGGDLAAWFGPHDSSRSRRNSRVWPVKN